jgi:MinD superfamily P-loop ATPase
MKEIVIISGKGGTGKTSFAASLAYLGGSDVVVVDCDVDAADMHLLLQPDFAKSEEFFSGELAVIDQEKCIKCGKCKEVCRFDAISIINNKYIVDPLSCEGCGYCARVCLEKAITNEDLNVGNWYISRTKVNNILVHAKLGIGADNSGKLVAKVKEEAKKIAAENNNDYIIVDGSPGTGCPVVSSLSGANFVVLVTEPSAAGLHDLKRVYELVKKFHIKAGCIINKADINKQKAEEVKSFLKEEKIEYIVDFPYDIDFTKAMVKGETIVEYDNGNLKNLVVESWNKIKEYVK